jgi:hypothetical protein
MSTSRDLIARLWALHRDDLAKKAAIANSQVGGSSDPVAA